MNIKVKSISIVLLMSVMMWMVPVPFAMAETSPGSSEAAGAQEAAEGQVVVLYEEGEMPDNIADLSASKADRAQEKILDDALDKSYTVEDTIVIESEDESADDIVVGVVSSDAMDTDKLVEALEDSDKIKYAEPNYKFTASDIPNWSDVYAAESWQVGDLGINADDVSGFSQAGGGDDIVIAVMDTGIDYNHEDLKDRMWTEPAGYPLKNKKKHGVDLVTNDQNPMDENGHGTHCAGIIAAAADNGVGTIGVVGKRSDIKLMAIRILDESGAGYLDSIVTGFKHLVRARKAGVNIKAVNCSFGADVTSDIFDEVIEQAGQAGVLTVAAAGNESTDNDVTPCSPANCKSDYVISVAAADRDGSLASYSNYGRKMVDVAAPGSNILSTVSYDSYTPYLYDNAKLSSTTDYYGEFTDAYISTDENGVDSVKPVLGTDYSGGAVDGVGEFGQSRMLANLNKGSKAAMSLDITSGDDSFNIGNNKDTLTWNIKDAEFGDEFLLYFPYKKKVCDAKDTIYSNVAFKTYTDPENGGVGDVVAGDIIVDAVGDNGKVVWSQPGGDDEEFESNAVPVSFEYNSIWHASGEPGAFFTYKAIKSIDNEATDGTGYGFGLSYVAAGDGDVRIDISSLAISEVNPEISEFGKYDVYSGTSMATPAVTGAVALIAAMNPDMSADDIRETLFATTTDSSESGKWSTAGNVNFLNYNPTEDTSKPAVRSVTADFEGRKVTLKGKGFGSNPRVEIHNNVSDAEGSWTAVPSTTNGGSIVIDDSEALGIIGSDITFKVTNGGGKSGYMTKYVVKGLANYDDAYEMMLQQDLIFFPFGRGGNKSDIDGEIWEDIPADPVMPAGLNYVVGANELLKYDADGTIHAVAYNEETKTWSVTQRGTNVGAYISEYAKELAKTDEFWVPDMEGNTEYIQCELIGNPVYLGDAIFELLRVTLDGDRDTIILAGLDLNGERDTWRVYYDSAMGVGSKPDSLNFDKYNKATLATYNGKIYMIGGAKVDISDELNWMEVLFGNQNPDDMVQAVPYKEVYSCEIAAEGSKWTEETSLPEARMLGTAIAQNGNLYYMFSNKDVDNVDYGVYKYDGKSWSRAGDIHKAIFTGYNQTLAEIEADMFIVGISGVGIPCALGVDDSGILFGGMSFDRSGDTFRFNTKTNKVEPLKYTLWSDIADRDVNGSAAGDKFYAEYLNEVTEKSIAKTIPIKSNYVKLEKTVDGDGTGVVIGGGYYTKGEKAEISITPDKDSYILAVNSEGTSPALDNYYEKPTKASKKTHKTTYNAKKNGSLNVTFGKLSTKVIMPKTKLKKAVGKRTVEAYTDGTLSDVKWTSSNKKYAKPNADGTITFKKAGLGKTVTLTATSIENSKLKAKCKVKIVSRQRKKFKWSKKKFTTKTKVLIDRPLGKSKTPKNFKASAKSGKKVKLSWKKVKGASGYIVLRKTGKGRFVQVAKVGKSKASYLDKKVKAGKKYQYVVVSYKKVKNSKAIRISKASKVRKVRARK